MGFINLVDPTNKNGMRVPPFWTGRASTVLFYMQGSKIPLLVVSWTCSPDMTEGKDHVNGEKRARPWRVVDGYEIKLTCKQRDTFEITTLLRDVMDDDDDETSVITGVSAQKSIAFAIKPRDGSSVGYTTGGIVTIGKWDWGVGGNTDRAIVTIPFHAQDFKEIPL